MLIGNVILLVRVSMVASVECLSEEDVIVADI